MAIEGMWTMTADGEFELAEEYKTRLLEAKLAAAKGWRDALYEYLAPLCPYSTEQLNAEMMRRVVERDCSPMELVDEFVIEALSGDLVS